MFSLLITFYQRKDRDRRRSKALRWVKVNYLESLNFPYISYMNTWITQQTLLAASAFYEDQARTCLITLREQEPSVIWLVFFRNLILQSYQCIRAKDYSVYVRLLVDAGKLSQFRKHMPLHSLVRLSSVSWLCHLFDLWSWANGFTSWSLLSFQICKMGMPETANHPPKSILPSVIHNYRWECDTCQSFFNTSQPLL